ncbi:MAG: hypothetical protein LBD30_02360 [Verrucomicrobiales bacterium]|nr:hypothetical protein [Verrucomicrobiales bacterium]
MSITIVKRIQELKKLETTAAELKATIEIERVKELVALPAMYGYDTLATFIKALKEASGKSSKVHTGNPRRAGRPDKEQLKAAILADQSYEQIAQQFTISKPYYYSLRSKYKKLSPAKHQRKRVRKPITPELKEEIIAAVRAGLSGGKISKQTGASISTIQKIKKESGLVKAQTEKQAYDIGRVSTSHGWLFFTMTGTLMMTYRSLCAGKDGDVIVSDLRAEVEDVSGVFHVGKFCVPATEFTPVIGSIYQVFRLLSVSLMSVMKGHILLVALQLLYKALTHWAPWVSLLQLNWTDRYCFDF